METTSLEVEWVPIDRLFGNPANPRKNDPAVPHVAASLRRFGWRQPMVAKPTGEVIAGNTRLKAARELALTEVPVVWFESSDLDAAAYAIADNRTHEFAEWDEPALAKLLDELRAEDGLEGVGFSTEDIDALLAEIEEAERDEVVDPGPGPPPEKPVSRRGDLWVLGEHRLLCGDATGEEDMARLMEGEKAHLLATDPPYLVDYQGGTGKAKGDWDQFKDAESAVDFFSTSLRVALRHCRETVPVYQWHAHKRQALVQAAWERVGLLLHQQIIWTKARGVFTRSHFMWQHEPCFYGWRKGKMPTKSRRPPATETTVWPICQAGQLDGVHPTQKPLEIFLRPMRFHTLAGEIVLEPFLGSGTQIIAAEALGRVCRAMELDPRYVDVAIRRWEQATGRDAVLDATGKTLAETAKERQTS